MKREPPQEPIRPAPLTDSTPYAVNWANLDDASWGKVEAEFRERLRRTQYDDIINF